MIQLVLVLVIACTLLLVVVLLSRGAVGRGRRSHDAVAIETSPPVEVRIPSRTLMDRIFADEDLSFVTAERDRSIRRQFLRERRHLALSWLGQTGREASRILRLHLRVVRLDLARHPAAGFRLVFHALLFFLVYGVLWVSVKFYGAFWARAFMRNAVTLAGSLSGLGSSILADAGRSGLRVAQSHGRA